MEKLNSRQFSKEHLQPDREEVAKKAKDALVVHRILASERKSEIEMLNNLKYEKEKEIEKIENWIRALEEEVDKINSMSVFEKIFSNKNNPTTQIESAKAILKEKKERYFDLNDREGELKNILDKKNELKSAREIIEQFYKSVPDLKNKYDENLKARNVASVAKKHKVIFSHGILNFDKQDSVWSAVHEGVDLETKIKINLAFSPTIATTCLDEKKVINLWSAVGLLISDGTIDDINPIGMSKTQADGLDRFPGDSQKNNLRNFKEIDAAKEIDCKVEKSKLSFNECVISDQKVAGIYYTEKNEGIGQGESWWRRDRQDEIYNVSKKLNLPLYLIKITANGQILHEADFDEKKGQIVASGKQIFANELIGKSPDFSEERKEQYQQEIINSNPFHFKNFPDLENFNSFSSGKDFYCRLLAFKEANSLKKENGKDDNEYITQLINNDYPDNRAFNEIRYVAINSTALYGRRHEYLFDLVDQDLKHRTVFQGGLVNYHKTEQNNYIELNECSIKLIRQINILPEGASRDDNWEIDWSEDMLDNLVRSVDFRIEQEESEINILRSRLLNFRKDNNGKNREEDKQRSEMEIKRLEEIISKVRMQFGYFLTGIAAAAEDNKDILISKKFNLRSGEYVDRKQFNNLKQSRIDSEGRFILKEDDLKYIASKNVKLDKGRITAFLRQRK